MIGRGEDWGERAAVPADAVVCRSDTEVAATIGSARRAGEPQPSILVTGGDLHRTLGGRPGRAPDRGREATRVSCDVGEALIDGTLHLFVAHLVIGGPFPWRPMTVVANAGRLGAWDVAPRAHPGDGLLDRVVMDLGLRQRMLAVRRLPSGAHLPHPDITTDRFASRLFDFERRPATVAVDGATRRRVRNLAVRLADTRAEIHVI